ncbi:pyruvate/2-oxoglutarate dehydrogenase complex, dihydrolipoamide dehydrogenase component [Spongiibacter sp. IMCC21906]|uniref:Si-specific NAD(P)(+) transhydrogenase n=1 Tax=Spongiibacter sp. IMCC21906 TaxID=1620392 RepID=UPI00062DCEA1|nr:Si-specific NAD(P)(+) transhydrogenase [Spongiibacter sp. IMCC21906]AKH69232.1 pyruvate/2-oxoglutarate dehydrogenase complex, dihydrolipoamide dehydrogenase component [Spongiibacter sp. IMCC21906]
MAYDYDVVVLGSGPAGESAALNASKHGRTVAVVEAQSLVGGACSHQGTIPSKALRHMVRQAIRFNQTQIFRDLGDPRTLTYPKLLSHAEDVISQQVAMRSRFYYRNNITLIHGQAEFVDAHSIAVLREDGKQSKLTAKQIVIATGSRPYRPADIDFNHPRVYDSDSILKMTNTPRKIIVYGAGVIGCEYASIFSGIGMKVELVNTRDRLLEFLDDEISDALSYHLRYTGVMMRHREEYEKVEADDNGVTLYLKSGKRLHCDALLWCNGRSGNTDNLKLSTIGLEADHRGQLSVNEHYQTAVQDIYAAGDVIGWPSLASAAYDQGRAAAATARGKEHCRFVDDVPTGIYTLPEISSFGLSERELTEEKIPYEVGRAFFKDTARGQISGETVGMLKLLFHVDTLEILGIHCFGAEAAEIIHIGQAIMKQPGDGNTLRYFVNTTFNYPTMAEAYRTAALNGLNRL